MQLLIEGTSKKASRRLEKLEKRIGGSTEMMGEVAELIAKRNKVGWGRVQLQPATIEYKAKYGESEEPLVESGKMREQLTTEKGIRLLHPTELRFGSDSPAEKGRAIPVAKAALLQKGTKHQKKHKVLKVTLPTRKLIGDLIMKYITEK